MPRVVKTKAGAAPAAKKAAAGAKKNSKLYSMPEKIDEGTVLVDLAKVQWRIGPSIGTGGFGEIYSACKVGEKAFDYVVKCEPHGNGPLFVEMHFYMRNARREDIEKFKRTHGVKSLGMPYMLGNGSADINGQKHRFIVMPRYGSDVAKHIKANGRLPEGTAYRLAIQMLDVYEFVHSCGYVHADLKAANILLGLGKGGAAQAYLVDYGLASHYTTKEFKPDPKKMHNGTIEYTSRDAHQGVATMRADLEILGYNLIEWIGGTLPWVREKQLTPPTKAQSAKEAFMANVTTELKKLFPKGVPVPLAEFMKYVAKMTYNETPDYDKCRNIFLNGLKQMKLAHSGDLDFKFKSTSNNNSYVGVPDTSKSPAVAAGKGLSKLDKNVLVNSSSEDICASDDDHDDVMFEPKRVPAKRTLTSKTLKTVAVTPPAKATRVKQIVSPALKVSPRVLNMRAASRSPKSPKKRTSTTPQSPPPQKKQKGRETPSGSHSAARALRSSPRVTPGASAKINFSPAISMRSSRPGKTVINDSLTPNPSSKKTYEFNFELDVSMDANVIVNVKRKKKAAKVDQKVGSQTPQPEVSVKSNGTANGDDNTPVTRVKVRKLPSTEDSLSGSPATPAVTLRKYKK